MSKRRLSLVAMVGFLVLAMVPALADSAVPPTFVAGSTNCSNVSSAPGGLSLTITDPVVDGSYTGTDGSVFVLSNATRRQFDFSTSALVYDVVVKGSGSNWYDYDGTGDGPVRSDTDLVIPNGNKLNLVHFCYSGNNAPVANNDSFNGDEDTTITGNVLSNDTDADLDALTAAAIGTLPTGVTLAPNGDVSYTPAADFNGQVSFTYKANDGFADSNQATVTLTVDAVNDPPVAGDDSYSTNEDTLLTVTAPGVLVNDTDIDSASLTAVLVTDVSNGTLNLGSDGSFTYDPNDDFNGGDSFTYTANDGFADSNLATVSITVVAVNDPPVAVDDSDTTVFNQSVEIDVLANDTDVEASSLSVTNLQTTTDQGGSAAVSSGGVTYTPPTGFVGTDTFTYTANDGPADSNVATVTVSVFAGELSCGENTGLIEDASGMSAIFFRLDEGPCATAKLFTVNFDPATGDNGEIEFLIDPAFTEAAEYTSKLTFDEFDPVANPTLATFEWDLDNPGGALTAADWCESAIFDGSGNLTSAVPPTGEDGCIASSSTVTVGPNGEAQTTWWVYFKFDLKTRG